MLPSEELRTLREMLGTCTAFRQIQQEQLRKRWNRNADLASENFRLGRELTQAREALQYQRTKSAQLRRERWEQTQDRPEQ